MLPPTVNEIKERLERELPRGITDAQKQLLHELRQIDEHLEPFDYAMKDWKPSSGSCRCCGRKY